MYRHTAHSEPCFVAPSPEIREKLESELEKLRSRKTGLGDILAVAREPRALGFNDGMILPPDEFPFGTPASVLANSGADRAPLRGQVRVAVILVDTSDKPMQASADHFRELFFSQGVIPTGSVREYFAEVTGGLVDIVGEVAGPYRLPHTMSWYANSNFGIGRPSGTMRARDMAQDALTLANPHVNFGPYDNDGNGFVDAFIVVHAGRGGEETANSGDIWSHKWVLSAPVSTDNTNVYGYLTIPEDAKIGVCAHELGHLLFGFPDLYDTDGTSEGVGNWCLMGGGSWNGGGNTPAHPSAWCKVNQGWASVNNVTANGTLTIPDVKSSRQVHRLWKDGAPGPEYFLLENRQTTGYDSHLPGGGLLLWHVDESMGANTDENHYKVGLVQADGLRQLETHVNRGDGGDPFPGTRSITTVSTTTTPSTKSFTGQDTLVSLSQISAPASTMTAAVTVRAGQPKNIKEFTKEHRKEVIKEITKERPKELVKEVSKEQIKELKERPKELKERIKEIKEVRKELKEKDFEKPFDRPFDRPFGTSYDDQALDMSDPVNAATVLLQQALELLLSTGDATPFIDQSLRPDLIGAPVYDDAEKRMAEGDARAKRDFDTPPAG